MLQASRDTRTGRNESKETHRSRNRIPVIKFNVFLLAKSVPRLFKQESSIKPSGKVQFSLSHDRNVSETRLSLARKKRI